MGDRSDFEKMLAEYKSNYVQFLTTGNDAYKTAYQNAQDLLEKMVGAKQKEVEGQKRDMQKFAVSYKDGTNDLESEYDKAAKLHGDAQKIEDEYQTARNRYDLYNEKSVKISAPLDLNNGYTMLVRFGVLLFLIPVLFLIGYWTPSSGLSMYSGFGTPGYPSGYPSTPYSSGMFTPPMTPASRGWLW